MGKEPSLIGTTVTPTDGPLTVSIFPRLSSVHSVSKQKEKLLCTLHSKLHTTFADSTPSKKLKTTSTLCQNSWYLRTELLQPATRELIKSPTVTTKLLSIPPVTNHLVSWISNPLVSATLEITPFASSSPFSDNTKLMELLYKGAMMNN